jgi:hypothetical protein
LRAISLASICSRSERSRSSGRSRSRAARSSEGRLTAVPRPVQVRSRALETGCSRRRRRLGLSAPVRKRKTATEGGLSQVGRPTMIGRDRRHEPPGEKTKANHDQSHAEPEFPPFPGFSFLAPQGRAHLSGSRSLRTERLARRTARFPRQSAGRFFDPHRSNVGLGDQEISAVAKQRSVGIGMPALRAGSRHAPLSRLPVRRFMFRSSPS